VIPSAVVCAVNLNPFARRQHLFDIAAKPIDVDSNFLSYRGTVFLFQFRPMCNQSVRGNDYLQRISLIGYSFSLRDHVVLSETINTFKSRLAKCWQHQDMIYDFQAELHGTGSRSLYRS